MSIRTRALFLTGLLAAVSCSDAGNPLAPEQPGPVPGLPSGAVQPLDCTITIATGELRCELPQPDAGGASAAGQLIIGGQNVYVRLASTNFAVNADTIQFDVTVQNLIRQPIGTRDGSTVDTAGVRVFFAQDPVSNNPNGPAAVANADGEAMFIGSGEPYFQWDEMLAQDEVSGPRTWKLQFNQANGSTSVSFRVYVAAQVQYPTGWIEVVPPADTLLPGESTTLSATAYDRVGRTDRVDQVNFRWSTVSESGIVEVDALTGEVTAGASSGTDTVRVTNDSGQEGFAVIVVNTPLVANDVTYPGLGNVTLDVPNGFGLAQFVSDADEDPVSIVAATDAPTAEGGLITVAANGSFSYRPAAGFTGTDSYTYTATDGTAFASGTLTLEVGDRYWFAQAGQEGTGTMASPGTLKAAEAGSAAGETIFVLDAGGSTAGVNEGVVLKDGQSLIGQGADSVRVKLAMPTGEADSLTVTLLAKGDAPGITRGTPGATVQLASNNTIRGLGISSTTGAGISGTNFGTLTTSHVVGVEAVGGPALLLNNGALAGTFAQVSSSGSTGAGLSLTNVTGTLAPTGGSITNPAGAGVLVSGGSVNLTWTGNVAQPNNAALVDVNGGHAGAIEFNTGTVSATNGTGLQFNGVSGTYTFAGTTTLNGGDAGVDITNSSDGTFTFGTGTSITNTNPAAEATAFNVYGSSPTVTYSGNITKGAGGILVAVGEQPGGSVTFQTGTLQATAGTGISLSNANGTVAFNGTTTLSGGPSVAVVGGSAGTISFASGASVTNPSSAGILVSASEPTFTYAGTVTGGAARPVQIQGMTGGSVAVSGALSGSAQGILVQNNNTGTPKTITFSGAVTLSTGANAAVTLANNPGATIGFTGGSTDLTTTTGTAFSVTGGGTVNVTGGGNGISTQTGSALALNGVSLGALGMSFASLNVTGAAIAPVVLTNVGVTTGSTLTVSGGSIVSGAGTRLAVSGGSVNVTWGGSIAQATAALPLVAVSGGHSGTVTFSGTLSATNGTGLQFDNADGSYTFSGTTTLNGGDAGIDVLNGSGGTFSFGSGSSITNPTGEVVRILNSSPSFTYAGALSKSNAGTGVLVQNSGGTIIFSGSTKTLNTGAATAVSLVTNTGANVTFSGGNLDIDTNGATGFSATGTGTLQVTGENNSINTVNGTALMVNGVTIGGSGLSFVRIDASNGANGIVLTNTGNTNGLQVTGTGSAGTGGTIQNMTSTGASFTTARNINLSWMNFINTPTADGGAGGVCDATVNTGCNAAVKLNAVTTVNLNRLTISGGVEQGITGTNVTGLSLTNSTIQNTGDAVSEHAIYINDLRGTTAAGTANLISGNTINNAGSHNIFINTQTATNAFPGSPDRLVIENNSITNPGSAGQSDGVTVTARGTANFQTVVQSNTFTSTRTCTDAVQLDAGGSARHDVVITGNTIPVTYSLGGTNINGCNTAINVSGASTSSTTFSVTNNPTVNAGVGTAINIASNGDSNLRGTISGHTNITVPAGLRDGISSGTNLENNGFGIDMVADATGSIIVNVSGNTVNGMAGGIRGTARNAGVAEMDATVQNNTFNSGGAFGMWPVLFASGNGNGQPNRVCVNFINNQSSTTAAFTEDYWLEQWTSNAFQLQGLTPASGATEAQVEAFVSSRDVGGATVEAFGGTTVAYTAATCATP